jgi:hypothetical protein
MPELLIAAAPLIVLVCSLLLGRYPGCEAILRLSERLWRRPRKRAPLGRRPRRPLLSSFAATGGMLIALGHAQRPPPLAP